MVRSIRARLAEQGPLVGYKVILPVYIAARWTACTLKLLSYPGGTQQYLRGSIPQRDDCGRVLTLVFVKGSGESQVPDLASSDRFMSEVNTGSEKHESRGPPFQRRMQETLTPPKRLVPRGKLLYGNTYNRAEWERVASVQRPSHTPASCPDLRYGGQPSLRARKYFSGRSRHNSFTSILAPSVYRQHRWKGLPASDHGASPTHSESRVGIVSEGLHAAFKVTSQSVLATSPIASTSEGNECLNIITWI